LANKNYEKSNDEEQNDDNDDDENEDEDEDSKDFDYTTQNYDLDDDNEEEDDDEKEIEGESKVKNSEANFYQNILDLIQLDKLISSVSDLFKQSTPVESSLSEKKQEPTEKKKN